MNTYQPDYEALDSLRSDDRAAEEEREEERSMESIFGNSFFPEEL
jgi:hypothetical protein